DRGAAPGPRDGSGLAAGRALADTPRATARRCPTLRASKVPDTPFPVRADFLTIYPQLGHVQVTVPGGAPGRTAQPAFPQPAAARKHPPSSDISRRHGCSGHTPVPGTGQAPGVGSVPV